MNNIKADDKAGEWVRGLFFAENLICGWLLSDASVRDINKHRLWFTVSISSYLPRTDVWQQLWRRTGNSDGRLSLGVSRHIFLFWGYAGADWRRKIWKSCLRFFCTTKNYITKIKMVIVTNCVRFSPTSFHAWPSFFAKIS